MILFCTTTSGKPLTTMEDPDSPWSDVTVGRTFPTPVAMMVYDEHGVLVFDTTGMPYSKPTAKASDDEPTISVAPAASDVPTAAPGRSSQPVARIDRALDVLNAPGSTRQEFQAYFNPRNFGPGDLEEVSPELWEEFRLHGAADEYDLHRQDLADEEAQGTEPDLDRPPGLSEATVADIPRTTLSGLEAQNPELHRVY